jgi:hypothetical protein
MISSSRFISSATATRTRSNAFLSSSVKAKSCATGTLWAVGRHARTITITELRSRLILVNLVQLNIMLLIRQTNWLSIHTIFCWRRHIFQITQFTLTLGHNETRHYLNMRCSYYGLISQMIFFSNAMDTFVIKPFRYLLLACLSCTSRRPCHAVTLNLTYYVSNPMGIWDSPTGSTMQMHVSFLKDSKRMVKLRVISLI